jgi:hypothetical protein
VLTLTPVSSSGTVTGQAVTRTVSVLAAKHKARAKVKAKVKLHRK